MMENLAGCEPPSRAHAAARLRWTRPFSSLLPLVSSVRSSLSLPVQRWLPWLQGTLLPCSHPLGRSSLSNLWEEHTGLSSEGISWVACPPLAQALRQGVVGVESGRHAGRGVMLGSTVNLRPKEATHPGAGAGENPAACWWMLNMWLSEKQIKPHLPPTPTPKCNICQFP